MNKWITAFILLFSATCTGAVINPTNCFEAWPWTNSVNASNTWWNVERTNKVTKQIFWTLEDRARAAGRSDVPSYANTFYLNGGILTNYVYDSGTWTTQVKMVRSVIITNQFTGFEYPVPVDLWTDFSGTTTATGFPVVTSQMVSQIDSTLEEICPYFLPAAISNVSVYLATSAGGTNPPHLPSYHFCQLLKDAGYDTGIDTAITNSWGIITNGTWHYTYPITTNGLLSLAAYTERAAYIAQLKTVLSAGMICNTNEANEQSYQTHFEHRNIGAGAWGWDTGEAGLRLVTNSAVHAETPKFPFAWCLTSADDPHSSFGPATTNFSEVTVAPVPYGIAKASDWPDSGWYFQYSVEGVYDGTRSNTTKGVWILDGGWWPIMGEHWATGITESITNTFTVTASGSSTSGTYYVYSYACNDGTWNESTVETYSNVAAYAHTSSWNLSYSQGKEWDYTRLDRGLVAENTNQALEFFGYYQTSASNVMVNITNYQTVSAVSGIVSRAEYFHETNTTDGFTFEDYEWISSVNTTTWPSATYFDPNTLVAETNTVDVSLAIQDETSTGVWARAKIYCFKPDMPEVYTNVASTISFWMAGGAIKESDDAATDIWAAFSEVRDYTNWTWNYDASALSGGVVLSNGVWGKFQEWTDYDDLIYNQTYSNGMIIYNTMYNSSYGYVPFEGTTTPRSFWAVSNAFFLIEYTFPKRF
jgi:hypothetical protein